MIVLDLQGGLQQRVDLVLTMKLREQLKLQGQLKLKGQLNLAGHWAPVIVLDLQKCLLDRVGLLLMMVRQFERLVLDYVVGLTLLRRLLTFAFLVC